MNLLIILAIFAAIALILLALLIYYWFDRRPGTAGGAPITGRVIDRFTTTPGSVTAGEEAEFVFQSQVNNPLSTSSQLRPAVGRRILFAVGPSPIVIVSINGNPVNADAGAGLTDASGRVSVIVLARGVPDEAPLGGIQGQASAAGAKRQQASFEIQSE